MRRLGATFAIAVALAACGGGGDDGAETPVSVEPGTEAPAATDPPTATAPPATDSPGDESAAPDEAPATTSAPPAAPTTTAAPIEVPEKLRHVGEAVGGGELDLSVYAGRDTIAWFWAPW